MTNMIARRIPKQNVQAMIRALRDAGLTVTKDGGIYECKQGEQLLFCALNGRRDYLVRMRSDLFA